MSYDKMYYTVFNAVTDALEVAEKMPDRPARTFMSQKYSLTLISLLDKGKECIFG